MLNNINNHIELFFINFKEGCLKLYKSFFKEKFNKNYDLDEDKFIIKGSKDNFIIRKNDRFEFLVKNGRIIAFKDLEKSNNYIYYKKGEKL